MPDFRYPTDHPSGGFFPHAVRLTDEAAASRSSRQRSGGGDRVEVADGFQAAVVPVRDGKVPHGPGCAPVLLRPGGSPDLHLPPT
ncbi:DUF397 domain-containing protein [Streptomyces sp. NRRL F-5135]|uniref:DUF397 domain-containing protein n=1 Tax=Streptomyces sp. NRRL F-5135 TaxID=1463858 RepID=UPI00099CD793|nr:DUF397 domain-containing protein [Streptomyces sp. NRRL F-5135]